MSQIVVSSNASGTGVVTLASPATSTNRTLTLPDSTGTVATAESTLTQFNASGSAPVYACRAWVNFNGVTTAVIRASGNVSSITRNGTGDYTVNFTTAMPDANYAVTTNGNRSSAFFTVINDSAAAPLAAAVRIATFTASAVINDSTYVYVSIFR